LSRRSPPHGRPVRRATRARRHCSSRGDSGRPDGCPGIIEKIGRLT